MVEKLLLFGIGYVLGARAGRERLDELVDTARRFAERDEVKMVLNLAIGAIEERVEGLTGGQRLRAA